MRLVVAPDGQVVADLGGGAFGRGAWVHPRPTCVRDAVRGGLQRGLKTKVTADAAHVTELLRSGAARRALSLLQAAYRARKAVLGTAAVEQAERKDAVVLLILAADARATAELSAVGRLAARGRVKMFKTKAELGAAFGRAELSLVALSSEDLAREVSRMISVSELEQLGGSQKVTEVG